MNKLYGMVIAAVALAFAGCVTSPLLSEDAAERLAAVDALTEQRKLAEVALDYCTEPYQELPTGCQMDVRIRAVERLTDRDLLMAVASFSIVKTAVKGKSCYVSLGEANAKLKELALDKLTEGKYIPSVLAAKEAFAIQPLFTKAMFGYYQIAGNPPATAESAWFAQVKGKEASVAKSFCSCLAEGVPVEHCQRVYGLFPASLSAETQKLVADSYKRLVTSADGVPDAVRALQLAEVVPASAVVKGDVDAMCKSVCSKVSSVGEFKDFGTLVNGVAKQYVLDAEGLIKSAATQVAQNLNSMQELADFASVLKPYTSRWVGQIGIEEQVRRCAAAVNNIDGIRTFASQLAFFNEVMLPNKTDIAGDAVISVLNAVVEGKAVATGSAEPTQPEEQNVKGCKRSRPSRTSSTRPGQKESIKDFVVAATELPADILSDKAIVAIFKNEGVADAYSRALRTDGYREEMGNELAGAAMRSGSFGDLLAAGMIMGAMGEKESPVYTKMFSHLISIMREGKTFVEAACYAKIYYPRNMLIEAAEKRMDSKTIAKCLLAVFKHSKESSWVINKTLSICENFVINKKNEELIAVRPMLEAYIEMAGLKGRRRSSSEMTLIKYRAVSCLSDPEKISTYLLAMDLDEMGTANALNAYMNSYMRAASLYEQQGFATKGRELIAKMSDCIASKISSDSNYIHNYEFKYAAKPLMVQIAKEHPILWAGIMKNVKLAPISTEFTNVVEVLSATPSLFVEFLHSYKADAFHVDFNKKLPSYRKNGNWVEYSPYFTYGFHPNEPVYYYNCDWFVDAICKASKLELSVTDRAKLNEVMKFVAENALNLDSKKQVYDAIVGDDVRAEIKTFWDASTRDIPLTTTALFNFSLDDSISKVKWENEWQKRYDYKRVRLRGKVVDVSQNDERNSKHEFTLILDGASELTDMTFVKKLAGKRREGQIDRDLADAREWLKRYQEDWNNVKKQIKNGKIEINVIGEGKKKLTIKEYYEMMPFWGKKGKMPEEVIAEQLKIVTDLEAKANGTSCEVSLLYKVEIPAEFKDLIGELNKGDVVVFEAYPGRVRKQRVYRSDRGGLSERRPEENVFEAPMSNGRIVPND